MIRVLLLEDDPHIVTVFRRILERRLGAAVRSTTDVGEILAAARGGDADLVVLDIALRDTTWEGRPVNGVGICRMLKADPFTARIPVLIATAHAMRGDAERLLAESGADAYVAKPVVDHEAFAAQVRRMVEEAA